MKINGSNLVYLFICFELNKCVWDWKFNFKDGIDVLTPLRICVFTWNGTSWLLTKCECFSRNIISFIFHFLFLHKSIAWASTSLLVNCKKRTGYIYVLVRVNFGLLSQNASCVGERECRCQGLFLQCLLFLAPFRVSYFWLWLGDACLNFVFVVVLKRLSENSRKMLHECAVSKLFGAVGWNEFFDILLVNILRCWKCLLNSHGYLSLSD